MKAKIAVEDDLSNVSQELETFGYEVVGIDSDQLEDVSAIVISGEDNNIMNVSKTQTRAPVINARGMTPVQIRKEIENRLVRI